MLYPRIVSSLIRCIIAQQTAKKRKISILVVIKIRTSSCRHGIFSVIREKLHEDFSYFVKYIDFSIKMPLNGLFFELFMRGFRELWVVKFLLYEKSSCRLPLFGWVSSVSICFTSWNWKRAQKVFFFEVNVPKKCTYYARIFARKIFVLHE